MCFSFEVSISTFIISWGISLYLLNKNLDNKQRQNIVFLMIFASMQLIDAIFWYTNMKITNLNYILSSYIIPSILSLQLLYNIFVINNNANIFIKLITLIYCGVLFYIYNSSYTKKSTNPYSSPEWGGVKTSTFLVLLFILLVFYGRFNINSGWIIVFLSFILSYLLSKNGEGTGSLWCIISNSLAIYYLYLY